MEPSGSLDVPLVGRDLEFDAAIEVVAATPGDAARVVLLAGEAGVGKSRLAREIVTSAALPSVWATCWEGEEAPSFWPWLQVLRAWRPPPGTSSAGSLHEVLGIDRDGDVHDNRFRLFDAFAAAVAEETSDGPALVVIDDLQWADAGSIRLLRFLAADVRARRLTVLGAYRDHAEPSGNTLTRAAPDLCRNGLYLHLDGLTETAVSQLSAHLGSEGVDGAALHRRSGGNPLFVREFARLADPATQTIPASVEAVVRLRIEALTPGATTALVGSAVLGTVVERTLLAHLLDVGVADVSDGMEEAVAAGLLDRHGDDAYGFAHSVVQETLYASIRPGERARLHTRAAALIEVSSAGRAVLAIAHHRRLGAVGADPVAATWAEKAAVWSFENLAYEQAANWYGHALASVDPDAEPDREARLLTLRAEALLAAGDVAAGRDTLRQAAAAARACGSAELLARAALGWGSGQGGFEVPQHDATQLALLREALAAVGPEPSGLSARLLSRLSVALSGTDDGPRRELSEQAIRAARDVEDIAALGHALAAHCDAIAGPDHSERRRDEAAEIVEIADRIGDRHLELLGRRHRASALLELGEIADFDVEVGRFSAVADDLQQPTYTWYVPLWRGLRALMRGDYEAAAVAQEAGRTMGERAESVNAMALTFTQWWVGERLQGRSPQSAMEMRSVLGFDPGGDPLVSGDAATRLRAVIDTQLGDATSARAHLEVLFTAGLRRRPMDAEWLPEMAQLAEVAVFTDHRAAISEIYDMLEPYAQRFCVEGIGAAFTGSVHWYLAMLANARGDTAAGSEHDRIAREAHRRVGFVVDPPRLAPVAGDSATSAVDRSRSGILAAEGATWAITFDGQTRRVRDGKGVRDIAVLVLRPGQEVHCLELVGGADIGAGTGPALDDSARNVYQRRILDLQEDVDEARAANDLARAERAEAELDALVEQLSQAFGLAGRSRPQGSSAERARSTVTSRVRAAIRQIDAAHPALGRHLQHSVRTGTWCVYSPESPVDWRIDQGA
jgi:hypothetical protein